MGWPPLRVIYPQIFKSLILILPLLISVAFLTLLERKILRLTGLRVGPNKVRFMGVLQPIGDAVKLSNKRVNSLRNFSSFFYYVCRRCIIFRSLLLFSRFFIEPPFFLFTYSLILILIFLGFNSFNNIIRGWRTFRKFSLLGRIRTVSQLISYEASLYLCLFAIVVFYFSFDLQELSYFHFPILFFLCPLVGYLWIPSFLAELNRTPYDFSEGERELVRGFNTEFGSSGFTLIFLAEYGNIIFFRVIRGFLFFSNIMGFILFCIFIIWIRSVLPRFRFDKLIYLSWKFIIPFLTRVFLLYYNFSC